MPSPADLARPVIETLLAEEATLARLAALVAQQLDAVRTRHHETLDALAIDTGNAAAELHRLRTQRERQARLLARVLRLEGGDASLESLAGVLDGLDPALASEVRAARERVRSLATRTHRGADTLHFALQFAASLGRDMVRVLQGAGSPAALHTYTKGGQHTACTVPTSYLNQMG